MNNPNQKIDGFTGKELKEAYWFATHKDLIVRIITIILVLICVTFWSVTVYGLIRYFFIDWASDQQMRYQLTSELIDYDYFRQKNQPHQLSVSGVQIFSLGNNRYDFAARIDNQNEKWAIESLKYYFVFGGQEERRIKETFILPNENKYLIDLGVESVSRVGDVKLVIESVDWRRIDNDFAAYRDEALNFEFTDVEFVSGRELKIQNIPLSKTLFTMKNNGPYNFWEGGFYILLYRGNGLVGINYIVRQYIDSGMKENVDVTWYQTLSAPTTVEVIPDINILDSGVFRPIEAGSGELK